MECLKENLMVKEFKTSAEWEALDESGVIVLDPDGWDRKNYEYSYYEEEITHEEYERRKMFSTCEFPKNFFKNLRENKS